MTELWRPKQTVKKMSTRSNIIVQRADGSWKCIYAHNDGYLEGVGQTLLDHYDSQALADKLVEPGDLSSLHESCDKPEGHSFDNQVPGYTVYYGRDRGEEGTEGTVGVGLSDVWPQEDTWTEYTYVYGVYPGGPNTPTWYVGDPDMGLSSLVSLELALKDPANFAPKPDVKCPWGVLAHRDPSRV